MTDLEVPHFAPEPTPEIDARFFKGEAGTYRGLAEEYRKRADECDRRADELDSLAAANYASLPEQRRAELENTNPR